jgi:hypothetical protein
MPYIGENAAVLLQLLLMVQTCLFAMKVELEIV